MAEEYCPTCYTALEVKDVAPCMSCGVHEHEIEHALVGQHTYAEYCIFNKLSLVLCNLCWIDFGSRDPTYFGLPKGARIGPENLGFVRGVEKVFIGKDKYCPACGSSLAWLKVVEKAREFLF